MTGDATTPANNYFQVYIYGIEYRFGVMESVAHQEGRLFNTVNSNSGASWRYEYSISDHLGNTRLTFADKTPDGIIKVEDGEVLEEAHYYPFGLAMEGPWINDAAALDTRYKFNGIERVQDFGLNMDLAMYRSYDPAIGRWWQIDPLAALAPEQTPYRFGFNNPMNYSDPFGLFETRKEARDYKRDEEIDGKVRKQKDGSFAIVNKKEKYGVTKDKEGSITFIKLGEKPKGEKPSSSDKFWGFMERLDEQITWEDDGSGEKAAKFVAEFNPIISGTHAYFGFTEGENYFGEKINTTESSLYALGAIPSLKAATALKVFGTSATIAGIIRVPKTWLKIKKAGSPNTLLSSALALKLGMKGTIKPRWTPWGTARNVHTYIGRTAVIWGPGMVGTGFLIEYLQNKNKQDNGTEGNKR